jgi:hypothetical protein
MLVAIEDSGMLRLAGTCVWRSGSAQLVVFACIFVCWTLPSDRLDRRSQSFKVRCGGVRYGWCLCGQWNDALEKAIACFGGCKANLICARVTMTALDFRAPHDDDDGSSGNTVALLMSWIWE